MMMMVVLFVSLVDMVLEMGWIFGRRAGRQVPRYILSFGKECDVDGTGKKWTIRAMLLEVSVYLTDT